MKVYIYLKTHYFRFFVDGILSSVGSATRFNMIFDALVWIVLRGSSSTSDILSGFFELFASSSRRRRSITCAFSSFI